MIDRSRSEVDTRRSGARRSLSMRVALATVAVAVLLGALAASSFRLGFVARAAEVDAVGAPAPVGFADIASRIRPAVVGVRVKLKEAAAPGEEAQPTNPFPPGSPFYRFFHRFGVPLPQQPPHEAVMALGSGFFISADGYIVTNNHVVAHEESVEVITDSHKTYTAKVVGTDPQTDLALLKVGGGTDFPYVRFATNTPHVGDWVLAIGNPFGLGGTVTAGIVSARGREIGAGPYEDFIQIDAPVNKGNSGGPTFNVSGEVIGVNTAIYTPSGGFVGVAFDIPAADAKLVVQQLKEKGHVTRGWIGVQIQRVTPAIAEALGLKQSQGALVAQVELGSPAAKGGVKTGDVITAVNGNAVKDSRDLARKIAALAPGTATKLGVFRDGKESTITVNLGEFPRAPAKPKVEEKKAPPAAPVLGLTLAPASTVAGAGSRGVVITQINSNSQAAETGLQTGDVILEVDTKAVNTPADVRKMVAAARAHSKRAVLLRVKRGETKSFVAVPLA